LFSANAVGRGFLLPGPVNLSHGCHRQIAGSPVADCRRPGMFLVPAFGIVYSLGKLQPRRSARSSVSYEKRGANGVCTEPALRPAAVRGVTTGQWEIAAAFSLPANPSAETRTDRKLAGMFEITADCSPAYGSLLLGNAPEPNSDKLFEVRIGPVGPKSPGTLRRSDAFRLRRALLRIE
jgi:hypothetical protein